MSWKEKHLEAKYRRTVVKKNYYRFTVKATRGKIHACTVKKNYRLTLVKNT
jgi:hypothetical protein